MGDDLVSAESITEPNVDSVGGELVDPHLRLMEHLERSKIPEVYGVSYRVVQCLRSRMGHSSLDIENIAKELNFSVRTLQRRLREQGYSFSQLRDIVRRNYAVTSVLTGKLRVDDIYTALDFSDRSSLALAFKRWTGYTPRAFGRKFGKYWQ